MFGASSVGRSSLVAMGAPLALVGLLRDGESSVGRSSPSGRTSNLSALPSPLYCSSQSRQDQRCTQPLFYISI